MRIKKRSIGMLAWFLMGMIVMPSLCHAKRLHSENWYRDRWCSEKAGLSEVVLPDQTRCDCIISEHAVEVEFADKWAEAIGQSLFYSLQTGKKAGIYLIMEDEKDRKYWIRLNSTIQHFNLPIDTWSNVEEPPKQGKADIGKTRKVGKTGQEILSYQQEIAYHIRNNWVYPAQVAGQPRDLEARLQIKILADGEIKDIRFEKRSGNRYLDESAYEAVKKSNPLPALPKGYNEYSVILGFTPAGLH